LHFFILLQALNGSAAAAGAAVGLEFYDPVQSSFLPMYTTGRNSPYGEQTLLLLQSLAEQSGLNCSSYAGLYGASYSNGFDGYMNASTVVRQSTYTFVVMLHVLCSCSTAVCWWTASCIACSWCTLSPK
jgi:hypothetical protein